MSKLISILLPLYNEELSVANLAISSICNQTYTKLEIILLLDNPSNIQLRDLIERFARSDSRIRCVFNETNLGLPETLNRGIDLSSGVYIARMDADDISYPERIEKQFNYMISHPNIDLLGSNAIIIDEEGKEIGKYFKLTKDVTIKLFLKYCNSTIIHPTWFGKFEVFKGCRYRNFLSGQDYDFLLRAYAKGFRFHNLSDFLLKYRMPQRTLSSISFKKAYEQYIHANIARAQFKVYLRTGIYPSLPQMNYDVQDKEKYMSTIPSLNDLRMNIYCHRCFIAIRLLCKIWMCDPRPIVSRIKSYVLYKILIIADKI